MPYISPPLSISSLSGGLPSGRLMLSRTDPVTTNTSAVGFAHGPTSGTSTAGTGGVVQVVTPTLIVTNLMKPNQRIGLPISMALEFVPEPGLMLLLASGVAGLALLGRRRMNR